MESEAVDEGRMELGVRSYAHRVLTWKQVFVLLSGASQSPLSAFMGRRKKKGNAF